MFRVIRKTESKRFTRAVKKNFIFLKIFPASHYHTRQRLSQTGNITKDITIILVDSQIKTRITNFGFMEPAPIKIEPIIAA